MSISSHWECRILEAAEPLQWWAFLMPRVLFHPSAADLALDASVHWSFLPRTRWVMRKRFESAFETIWNQLAQRLLWFCICGSDPFFPGQQDMGPDHWQVVMYMWSNQQPHCVSVWVDLCFKGFFHWPHFYSFSTRKHGTFLPVLPCPMKLVNQVGSRSSSLLCARLEANIFTFSTWSWQDGQAMPSHAKPNPPMSFTAKQGLPGNVLYITEASN